MSKKKILGITILLILTLSILFISSNATKVNNLGGEDALSSPLLTVDSWIKDENLKLKIELLGFDDEIVNDTAIEEQLFSIFDFNNDIPYSRFIFDFEFNFVGASECQNLETFILAHSQNGSETGYEVNTTQLSLDLSSGERNDIFIPTDGRAINAKEVEQYIYEELYQKPTTEPGYTLYLLNFSQLDNQDHTLEHWYDISSIGYDSNESTTWWYSGYGDLEKRSAAGWGGKYRFCFLDLSARTWFFDFINTAWPSLGLGYTMYYQYPDLEALAEAFDFSTATGQEKLSQYIAEWVNAYLANVYSGPVYEPPIGKDFSMQVIVFNNLTINGYAEEDLRWCISESRIKESLDNDLPWINWDISIEWTELQEQTNLYNYIQENYQEDVDGKYIEVTQGLFNYLRNNLSDYFDLETADEVLPCYFFLTNDFSLKYGGVSFAGLGGMGWEILLGTQNSIFEDGDINSPRRGMSSVMIHELGHSLGLPHPHSSMGWGSAFVADVMSYFAYDYNFSIFYKDALGRAHADANYLYAQMELDQTLTLIDASDTEVNFTETIVEINVLLDEIPEDYNQMDYANAATKSIQARDLISQILDEMDSNNTTTNNTGINLGFLMLMPILGIIGILAKRKQ